MGIRLNGGLEEAGDAQITRQGFLGKACLARVWYAGLKGGRGREGSIGRIEDRVIDVFIVLHNHQLDYLQ